MTGKRHIEIFSTRAGSRDRGRAYPTTGKQEQDGAEVEPCLSSVSRTEPSVSSVSRRAKDAMNVKVGGFGLIGNRAHAAVHTRLNPSPTHAT